MRWQYAHLNDTPYLYSSKELRKMYKESKGIAETKSIMHHMTRHEVHNDKEYRGYYRLAHDILDDLYGEEEEILDWSDVINHYQPIKTPTGLQLKRKVDSYDNRW